MTRSLCASALLASALLTSVAVLGAEQFATAEEARAMLDRAVAALKANEDAALKAFNDEKNKNFRDRDLFVFCFSLPDGNFTAYESPLMVGTDVRELKLEKDPIGQRAYDVVASAGKATSSPSTTVSQSLDRNSQLPSSRSKHASANRPAELATSSSKVVLGPALATRT